MKRIEPTKPTSEQYGMSFRFTDGIIRGLKLLRLDTCMYVCTYMYLQVKQWEEWVCGHENSGIGVEAGYWMQVDLLPLSKVRYRGGVEVKTPRSTWKVCAADLHLRYPPQVPRYLRYLTVS